MAKALGLKIDFKPGQHLAPDALDKIAATAKPILASADDVARAVLYAVTQPIELNVFEIVVRPQRDIPNLPA